MDDHCSTQGHAHCDSTTTVFISGVLVACARSLDDPDATKHGMGLAHGDSSGPSGANSRRSIAANPPEGSGYTHELCPCQISSRARVWLLKEQQKRMSCVHEHPYENRMGSLLVGEMMAK